MITGKEIREAREQRGLTLRELAKLVGIPHTAIHRLETGWIDRMNFGYVVLVAKTLGLTLPAMEAETATEQQILAAFRQHDYSLVLRIVAAHIERKD